MNNYFSNRNAGRKEMIPDISGLAKKNEQLKAKLAEAIGIITFYAQEYDNGIKAKGFLEGYQKD